MSEGSNPQPSFLPQADPRPAREVIDAAIRENRYWERICYVLVVGFAAVGVGVIVYGVYTENAWIALVGSVAASLFWPALNSAVSIRRANISIRLLEVPLNQAKTAKQAAEAIKDAFVTHFAKGRTDVVSKTQTQP